MRSSEQISGLLDTNFSIGQKVFTKETGAQSTVVSVTETQVYIAGRGESYGCDPDQFEPQAPNEMTKLRTVLECVNSLLEPKNS